VHFTEQNVVFHRREMLDAKGLFIALKDPDRARLFNRDLLDTLARLQYVVITVAIDKKLHKEKYGRWQFHPYNYCMTCLVERYAKWMHRHDAVGDVLAKSRNKNEDEALKASYS
jgi:hypothetical protein